MRTPVALLFAVLAVAPPARGGLSVERAERTLKVRGDHFILVVDLARGGEISELQLHDGSRWNTALAAPEITFPRLELQDKDHAYALANDAEAKLTKLSDSPEKVSVAVQGRPRAADGTAGPWRIALSYEIHPEGAVFIDLDGRLEDKPFALSRASVSFAVSEAIRKGPQYRDRNVSIKTGGFPSARVAFGTSKLPARSFTNEIEVMVEHKKAIGGTVGFQQKDGRVTWTLGGGGAALTAPLQYQNRIALGLGAAVTGKPKSNVIGQRVYHWVNWLGTKDWYPTNEQIDKMVARHATMLILHHEWMLLRGSNGYPHADYAVVRNHNDMVRMIDHAHRKGLRVGLYMRGVEPYALKTRFFQKYCKRNWDGIYVDWHGPGATSYHDNRYKPETPLGDTHFSKTGTHVPARAYFLFTRELRDIVGPGGFLIGHQGSFNSGVLANLCFDAYLPGETGSDRKMLSGPDEAAYKGMLGGGVCMPWMLDLPKYRNAEGAAKMAAWGLYPHLVLGIKARHTKGLVFPCAPDDALYDFILPYWRILAKIDVEKATVFNTPAQNVVAATPSDPAFHSVVYRAGKDTYLLIVANLGPKAGTAEMSLNPDVLGMTGEYQVGRIDAATGNVHPCNKSTGKITTTKLPPWGLEGYTFCKQ